MDWLEVKASIVLLKTFKLSPEMLFIKTNYIYEPVWWNKKESNTRRNCLSHLNLPLRRFGKQ